MKNIKLKSLLSERYKFDKSFLEDDYITDEDVKRLPNINGYVVDVDRMSGSIGWFKKDQDKQLYATPSWDGNPGWVPFDDEDGNHYGELDFTKNPKFKGNKKLQMKAYISALKMALKKLEINIERDLNKK